MTRVILQELITLLGVLDAVHYKLPLPVLSNATIGQHVRHSVEIYHCVFNGYAAGIVDYGQRKRDHEMESSSTYALKCIQRVLRKTDIDDKPLLINNDDILHPSSFSREVLYCDEHAVHHMALIRIGINYIGGYEISENLGVAPSTIQYRLACAQ